MEHEVPNFEPQESGEQPKKRWAFLRRNRQKDTSAEHNPVDGETTSPPRRAARRGFAHRLADLLSNGQPESPAPPTDLPSPETEAAFEDVEHIVNRRRKWGESVLNLVADTARRVKRGPKSPTRSKNEQTLGDATADMEDAQAKLFEATDSSDHDTPTVESPHFAGAVKHEVRRTFGSIKAERERLKQADPPSETAQMLTLGVLALFGGGLFMSAWQEQKIKKVSRKLAEQERVIDKQEIKIQKLEQKVEAQLGVPDRELVRRIGAFTHEQAAVTREVAQEVSEYRSLTQEMARPHMPESTFAIPEVAPIRATPEVLPYSALLEQQEQTQIHARDTAQTTSPTPEQTENSLTKQQEQTAAKKLPVKDPATNYALVFMAIAFGLAVWFIFLR